MVGKSVLVCCMTSLCKWSIVLNTQHDLNKKQFKKKKAVEVFYRVVPHWLCPTTQRVYGIVYSQTLFCYGDPCYGSKFLIEGYQILQQSRGALLRYFS